ncbi:unnamed protein product [Sphagnum compactum]
MGNACRRLVDCCSEPSSLDGQLQAGDYQFRRQQNGGSLCPAGSTASSHGVTVHTAGFAALARDLFQFEITSQVPDGLSQYVQGAKATQAVWYRKILSAWKSTNPPPTNAAEASCLVLRALQGHRKTDVQGLLSFYDLIPVDATTVVVPLTAVTVTAPTARYPHVAIVAGGSQGLKYEIQTLPVDSQSVADGDTVTVYVDVMKDAREKAAVPQAVIEAVRKRRTAQLRHDLAMADALQTQIKQAGYKIFTAKNSKDEVLARKYRVRLRGVDAPETKQPYGPQAKAVLLSLVEGRSLRVLVYGVDQYGRIVADIYCKNVFIQEVLFKKGCVWHYVQYDRRPEFAQWEKDARAARVGLWANANPEKPWDYRRQKKNQGSQH